MAFYDYIHDVYREAVRLTEAATLSYKCSIYSPITVALASVMSVIRSMNRFLIDQNDPVQIFMDAVHCHLGEVGGDCDAPEVQDCINVRMYWKPVLCQLVLEAY